MHMVPIEKFENLFSDRILERATSYNNESSIDILAIHPTHIKAKVYGTYLHTVDINFEDDVIAGMYCTCPYEWEHCKHLAAVLMFYLEYEGDFPEEIYERCVAMEKHPSFESIIENADKEELVHFIQTAIKQNPFLFDQAKLFFMPDCSDREE